MTWSLSPGAPGTVSATGLYTPPNGLAGQQTIYVIATSQADPTKSASAVVTLLQLASVSAAPGAVTLYSGQTQQFTASVSNAVNAAVTWTLTPTSASSGTISATGLYTAPSAITTAQTVFVVFRATN